MLSLLPKGRKRTCQEEKNARKPKGPTWCGACNEKGALGQGLCEGTESRIHTTSKMSTFPCRKMAVALHIHHQFHGLREWSVEKRYLKPCRGLGCTPLLMISTHCVSFPAVRSFFIPPSPPPPFFFFFSPRKMRTGVPFLSTASERGVFLPKPSQRRGLPFFNAFSVVAWRL
jgi:hypothetical protein